MRKTMWDDYLDWLDNCYGFYQSNYGIMLKELTNRPFEAILERDTNRLGDAESLRGQYFVENGISGSFIDHPISILEVLLALAIRIDSEYIGSPNDPHPNRIFWEMLDNLGLKKFDNRHINIQKMHYILDIWTNRTYNFNGNGGIFPLEYVKNDQRNVEIWDQAMAYLTENYV